MQNQTLIDVQSLQKYYPVRAGVLDLLKSHDQKFVKAVDGINFQIAKGDIFALAGESGCGKTTTGKLLSLLEAPTGGSIRYGDVDLARLKGKELKEFRSRVQMIFQDPYESLDPRFTVLRTVSEPLIVHGIASSEEERTKLVSEMIERVGLKPARDFLHRYPHELSGGQRQRIAIARAMVLHPAFIVADEPVSMLDVSIRASVLNLMLRLREELDVTYLFITHDLAVARYMSNKMAIMYLGEIVEMGATDDLINHPMHPYTNLLMSAVPIPDPSEKRERVRATSEIPNPIDAPPGCKFHPRCSSAKKGCSQKRPELIEVTPGHIVACHRS